MQARRKIYTFYIKLPHSLKIIMSNLARVIPIRFVYGKAFSIVLDNLKETEHWSKRELSNLRSEKLQGILLHAFKTTPFYRKAMIAKGITETSIIQGPEEILQVLDFIDKSVISSKFNEFLSSDSHLIPSDYCSTGGTSGEPFYFFIDSSRSAKEWAFFVDQWSRVGFNNSSRRVTFRGSKIHGKGWEDDWITRERKFSSFELTDEYLNRIWPLMKEFRPDYVYAYPSTALTLCQFMERRGKMLPNTVKAILLGSENIYKGQREYISKVSGKRIFIWYGHSEKLVLAGECERSSYYHAYPQYGYVEFINDKGQAAKPGEFAEIVGTGFFRNRYPIVMKRVFR